MNKVIRSKILEQIKNLLNEEISATGNIQRFVANPTDSLEDLIPVYEMIGFGQESYLKKASQWKVGMFKGRTLVGPFLSDNVNTKFEKQEKKSFYRVDTEGRESVYVRESAIPLLRSEDVSISAAPTSGKDRVELSADLVKRLESDGIQAGDYVVYVTNGQLYKVDKVLNDVVYVKHPVNNAALGNDNIKKFLPINIKTGMNENKNYKFYEKQSLKTLSEQVKPSGITKVSQIKSVGAVARAYNPSLVKELQALLGLPETGKLGSSKQEGSTQNAIFKLRNTGNLSARNPSLGIDGNLKAIIAQVKPKQEQIRAALGATQPSISAAPVETTATRGVPEETVIELDADKNAREQINKITTFNKNYLALYNALRTKGVKPRIALGLVNTFKSDNSIPREDNLGTSGVSPEEFTAAYQSLKESKFSHEQYYDNKKTGEANKLFEKLMHGEK